MAVFRFWRVPHLEWCVLILPEDIHVVEVCVYTHPTLWLSTRISSAESVAGEAYVLHVSPISPSSNCLLIIIHHKLFDLELSADIIIIYWRERWAIDEERGEKSNSELTDKEEILGEREAR